MQSGDKKYYLVPLLLEILLLSQAVRTLISSKYQPLFCIFQMGKEVDHSITKVLAKHGSVPVKRSGMFCASWVS